MKISIEDPLPPAPFTEGGFYYKIKK